MTVRAEIEARLSEIRVRDGALRSFVRLDDKTAIRAAIAADARRLTDEVIGPLDGLSVAVKDNLAVGGTAWAAGVAGWRDRIAAADATAVAGLRAAGAVILGSTNMDEAALGAVTDNAAFGRTINPLRPGHTPGGSSGGSAAAVAAGLVDLALGTDTMGSVRLPAAYCGIAGIKPTFGLIGRTGLACLAPSLDTIGPLARDIGLLAPALEALAGPDPGDPGGRVAPARWATRHTRQDFAALRFGVPEQIGGIECENAVRRGFVQTLQAVEALGAKIVRTDLSGWEPEAARRAGLLVIEAEAAVELAGLIETDGALSPALAGMLRFGRDAPAAKLIAAQSRMRAAAAALDRALAEVDALILPTAPQRAFAHGRPAPADQAVMTALANFAGAPAVALPVWFPEGGLPASVQLVGPRWSDLQLLDLAELLAPALVVQP